MSTYQGRREAERKSTLPPGLRTRCSAKIWFRAAEVPCVDFERDNLGVDDGVVGFEKPRSDGVNQSMESISWIVS